MTYMNCYVASVPSENRDRFIALAKEIDSFFKNNGALRVVECWGNDVPHGKQTDYYRAVAAPEGETIVVGWIEWPDKILADRVMGQMMRDPAFSPEKMEMPFDGKRMIFGGFDVVVDL